MPAFSPATSTQRTNQASRFPTLDATDRRLLWLLDLDPTAPIRQLAEALDVSPRTVQRRFIRLQQAGVVRVVGRTLPGFDGRLAWLVRAHGHPAAIADLANHLRQQVGTRWVRTTTDESELISGLVTLPGDREASLQVLASRPGIREVRTVALLEVWGRSLAARTASEHELDAVDQQLMRLLEHDGRAENRVLAEALGLDRSTVSRRRKRLTDAGILYFEADIHPRALGDQADLFCWLRVTPGMIRTVAQQLRARTEVRFVAATTGTTNLAVHVVLPDGTATIDLLDDVFGIPGVVSVEIQTMGRVYKRNA